MSLILEALKRSEQERRRERVPDLRSVHAPVAMAPARPFPWRLLLGVLLVLNLNGLGVWWLLQREPAASATGQVERSSETDAPAAVLPSRADDSGEVERAPPAAGQAVAVVPAHEASLPPPEPRPAVRSLSELSPTQRASLPAMTFSFHVFSDNPGRRSIIINERRLGEGEEVAPGWWLEEITAEGVVLAGAGERIYIPVLSQW